MDHRTRALAIILVTLPLAAGCVVTARDQRVSEAPPPAVPAPGALIAPPTGWRPSPEGQVPVPIAGHPPITTSGVVATFDPGTEILTLQDGRMVKLTGRTRVVEPVGNAVRVGDLVVLQDVLPIGVQVGAKTLTTGKPQRLGTVAGVDEPNAVVTLTDGTVVHVTRTTNLHLGARGSSAALTQLAPGDELLVVLGDAAPSDAASESPSALPRLDVVSPAPAEAVEVMIFRVPRRP